VHTSRPHDYFTIPHGTIHGSGKNNLVLEISSTPYIFTFKIYDWLRVDLNGKPRTLNIQRAFENLNFEQSGKTICKENINNIKCLVDNNDVKIFHLITPDRLYYEVHRIEMKSGARLDLLTNGAFNLLMLVEGECVYVRTRDCDYSKRFSFAESFLLPAGATAYTIENKSSQTCKLVKAFLKK
jgi:mannose-6-phosphate isomerase class I